MDQGVAELRRLLADIGVRYPRSPSGALLAVIGRLAQLRAHGVGFRQRSETEVSLRELTRIDACNSAAKGLVFVDPVRGTYFSLLSLLLALRAGEARRIGRGLCMGGGAMMPAGGPFARWGLQLLDAARRIAEQGQNPYLRAITAITTGQNKLAQGHWAEALSLCDAGSQLLKDNCQGADLGDRYRTDGRDTRAGRAGESGRSQASRRLIPQGGGRSGRPLRSGHRADVQCLLAHRRQRSRRGSRFRAQCPRAVDGQRLSPAASLLGTHRSALRCVQRPADERLGADRRYLGPLCAAPASCAIR